MENKMHILPNIIAIGEYYVIFSLEEYYFRPYMCGFLRGSVNVDGDIYDVNVYMDNIENNGEIIYPKRKFSLDIYDYEIIYFIENDQLNKAREILHNLLKNKLLTLH